MVQRCQALFSFIVTFHSLSPSFQKSLFSSTSRDISNTVVLSTLVGNVQEIRIHLWPLTKQRATSGESSSIDTPTPVVKWTKHRLPTLTRILVTQMMQMSGGTSPDHHRGEEFTPTRAVHDLRLFHRQRNRKNQLHQPWALTSEQYTLQPWRKCASRKSSRWRRLEGKPTIVQGYICFSNYSPLATNQRSGAFKTPQQKAEGYA